MTMYRCRHVVRPTACSTRALQEQARACSSHQDGGGGGDYIPKEDACIKAFVRFLAGIYCIVYGSWSDLRRALASGLPYSFIVSFCLFGLKNQLSPHDCPRFIRFIIPWAPTAKNRGLLLVKIQGENLGLRGRSYSWHSRTLPRLFSAFRCAMCFLLDGCRLVGTPGIDNVCTQISSCDGAPLPRLGSRGVQ